MEKPIITMETVFNNVATPRDTVDAGTVFPGEKISLTFQIWNNRWGTSVVNNAINCSLIIRSSYIDELLPILSNSVISIDGEVQELPTLIKNKIVFEIKQLSGQINKGLAKDAPENVTEVNIEFDTPEGFKSGNKNLIFNMEYNETNF